MGSHTPAHSREVKTHDLVQPEAGRSNHCLGDSHTMTHHEPHCGLPSSGYFDKPFRLLCKTLDTRTSFVDWASVATNNLAGDNILRVFNAVAHLGQWQPTPVKTKCSGRNRSERGSGGNGDPLG